MLKRKSLGSFIERVEINLEPTEKGQILKKIKFRIPICFDGNDGSSVEVSLPNEKNNSRDGLSAYQKSIISVST